MRVPYLSSFLLRPALCLALLTPGIALAQGPAHPRDAAHADAAVAPLAHPAMAALPFDIETPAPHAWHQAHDAVGEFPRGHADIVAWEQRAAAAPAARSAASAPPSAHGAPHRHMEPAADHPSPRPAMRPHHHSHGSKP